MVNAGRVDEDPGMMLRRAGGRLGVLVFSAGLVTGCGSGGAEETGTEAAGTGDAGDGGTETGRQGTETGAPETETGARGTAMGARAMGMAPPAMETGMAARSNHGSALA
jgi:hypothetical protein